MRITFLMVLCMAVLAGCSGQRLSDGPKSVVSNAPCRGFVADILVPSEHAPQPALEKRGNQHITEGCPPQFQGIFRQGARPGELWIIFGDQGARQCDAAVTPFMDRATRAPVCEFAVRDQGRIVSRPVSEGVCVAEPGCKYDIEHRVTNGQSPYPLLDPYIIIIQ